MIKKILELKDRFTVNKQKKDVYSLGIDIGSARIKMAELKTSSETVELCHFALEPIALDIVPILQKITAGTQAKGVHLSLSGSSAVVRYIKFPKMNIQELKNALKFEVQKYIPFATEEVLFDCFILNSDLPDNKMLVLLAAAKKDLINQRLKAVEGAGLSIRSLSIDAVSLVNAFNYNYSEEESVKNKTIALLNIGAAMSNLNIVENGSPRFSRDMHTGENDIIRNMKEALAADFKTQDELQALLQDKEKAGKAKEIIESISGKLAAEIRTSFDYYESQSAASAGRVFISGGASHFDGLKENLGSLLGLEMEYWDALRKVIIPPSIDTGKLKLVSNHLGVAVGLALSGA